MPHHHLPMELRRHSPCLEVYYPWSSASGRQVFRCFSGIWWKCWRSSPSCHRRRTGWDFAQRRSWGHSWSSHSRRPSTQAMLCNSLQVQGGMLAIPSCAPHCWDHIGIPCDFPWCPKAVELAPWCLCHTSPSCSPSVSWDGGPRISQQVWKYKRYPNSINRNTLEPHLLQHLQHGSHVAAVLGYLGRRPPFHWPPEWCRFHLLETASRPPLGTRTQH